MSLSNRQTTIPRRNVETLLRYWSYSCWKYYSDALGNGSMTDSWYINLSNKCTLNNLFVWMNVHWAFICFRCTSFPAFQYHDVMKKKSDKGHLIQRRDILFSPRCGDTTSCIRHVISDRLLSWISKESLHNVR